MAGVLQKDRQENPREYMVSAPVDLNTKNKIIEMANSLFDGIEARVIRDAIARYVEEYDRGTEENLSN